jgi:hypothetical protein
LPPGLSASAVYALGARYALGDGNGNGNGNGAASAASDAAAAVGARAGDASEAETLAQRLLESRSEARVLLAHAHARICAALAR